MNPEAFFWSNKWKQKCLRTRLICLIHVEVKCHEVNVQNGGTSRAFTATTKALGPLRSHQVQEHKPASHYDKRVVTSVYIASGINKPNWRTKGVSLGEDLSLKLASKMGPHCYLCLLAGHLKKDCKTPGEFVSALRYILQYIVEAPCEIIETVIANSYASDGKNLAKLIPMFSTLRRVNKKGQNF